MHKKNVETFLNDATYFNEDFINPKGLIFTQKKIA